MKVTQENYFKTIEQHPELLNNAAINGAHQVILKATQNGISWSLVNKSEKIGEMVNAQFDVVEKRLAKSDDKPEKKPTVNRLVPEPPKPSRSVNDRSESLVNMSLEDIEQYIGIGFGKTSDVDERYWRKAKKIMDWLCEHTNGDVYAQDLGRGNGKYRRSERLSSAKNSYDMLAFFYRKFAKGTYVDIDKKPNPYWEEYFNQHVEYYPGKEPVQKKPKKDKSTFVPKSRGTKPVKQFVPAWAKDFNNKEPKQDLIRFIKIGFGPASDVSPLMWAQASKVMRWLVKHTDGFVYSHNFGLGKGKYASLPVKDMSLNQVIIHLANFFIKNFESWADPEGKYNEQWRKYSQYNGLTVDQERKKSTEKKPKPVVEREAEFSVGETVYFRDGSVQRPVKVEKIVSKISSGMTVYLYHLEKVKGVHAEWELTRNKVKFDKDKLKTARKVKKGAKIVKSLKDRKSRIRFDRPANQDQPEKPAKKTKQAKSKATKAEASPKKVVAAAQKTSKGKSKKPAKNVTSVKKLAADVQFIGRFVRMIGKVRSFNALKNYLKDINNAMDNGTLTKKTAKYENEIMYIQKHVYETLEKAVEEGKEFITLSVPEKRLNELVEIAGGEKVFASIGLLKSYYNIQGTSPDAKKVENLLKKINSLISDNDDPYEAQLKKAAKNLKSYLDDDAETIKIEESELSGLAGIIGGLGAMPGAMSAAQLMNKQYEMYDFTGKYLEHFGKPQKNFKMMIYAKPGYGKSTYTLDFSRYLATAFGPVAYVSGEEFDSYTLQDKLSRVGGQVDNLYFFKSIPDDLSRIKFLVIDSVNVVGFSSDDFDELKEKYPDLAIITIFQTTKTGQFRGAQSWEHDNDIVLTGEDYGQFVTSKNRFAPAKAIKVFEDNREVVKRIN